MFVGVVQPGVVPLPVRHVHVHLTTSTHGQYSAILPVSTQQYSRSGLREVLTVSTQQYSGSVLREVLTVSTRRSTHGQHSEKCAWSVLKLVLTLGTQQYSGSVLAVLTVSTQSSTQSSIQSGTDVQYSEYN